MRRAEAPVAMMTASAVWVSSGVNSVVYLKGREERSSVETVSVMMLVLKANDCSRMLSFFGKYLSVTFVLLNLVILGQTYHQLLAHDAFGETGKVFNQSRGGQLAACSDVIR